MSKMKALLCDIKELVVNGFGDEVISKTIVSGYGRYGVKEGNWLTMQIAAARDVLGIYD